MDGYGRPVHIDAYFSTFPDEAGGWGVYLPTTGWDYDESGLVSSTHLTGSTLKAELLAGTDVSSRIADYIAQGFDSQLTNRYTVFTLASGAENELVYLFGAADGCYEVRVHWTLGEDRETSSGYSPYLQTRYEGQLLKQMAASFTPLDTDGARYWTQRFWHRLARISCLCGLSLSRALRIRQDAPGIGKRRLCTALREPARKPSSMARVKTLSTGS